MQKSTLLVFLFFLLVNKSGAQNTILDGVYFESDEELIGRINNIKSRIDADIQTYRKVEMEADSLGSRYAYFDGKELILVKTSTRMENLYRSASWYFDKGRLIYGESFMNDSLQKSSFRDEKLFLDNEHLFWWTIDDKPVDRNSVNFKKSADEIGVHAIRMKLENKLPDTGNSK